MKVVGVQDTNLLECLREARRQGVVLTLKGKPVALLVGVEGLDLEQIELGHSDEFWKLIRAAGGGKILSVARNWTNGWRHAKLREHQVDGADRAAHDMPFLLKRWLWI